MEFTRGWGTGKLSLYGYCDASWGCQEDGSWVRGFVLAAGVQRNNQQLLYLLLKPRGVQEAIWLRHLLKDLGYLQRGAAPIHEDNPGCIKIAKMQWWAFLFSWAGAHLRTGIKGMDWSDSIWGFLSGRKSILGPLLLTPGRKAIPIKWVLKRRLMLKEKFADIRQDWREGIDFVEPFAPVPKSQSIRCSIAIGAYNGLKLEQVDVVTTSSSETVERCSPCNSASSPLYSL